MPANAGIHGGERRNWRSSAQARAKALDPRFRGDDRRVRHTFQGLPLGSYGRSELPARPTYGQHPRHRPHCPSPVGRPTGRPMARRETGRAGRVIDPAPRRGLPPARVIWISSGLRGRASGLREFPAFGRLDLFGIPWILSSEMSLFNGLHATPGQFYFLGGPFPGRRHERPAVVNSKIDHTEPARRAEEARQVEDHSGQHRKGPIGHCDQANAVFAFWQEIVDSPRFLPNLGGRSRAGRSSQLHRRAPASGARRGPRGPFGRR